MSSANSLGSDARFSDKPCTWETIMVSNGFLVIPSELYHEMQESYFLFASSIA